MLLFNGFSKSRKCLNCFIVPILLVPMDFSKSRKWIYNFSLLVIFYLSLTCIEGGLCLYLCLRMFFSLLKVVGQIEPSGKVKKKMLLFLHSIYCLFTLSLFPYC